MSRAVSIVLVCLLGVTAASLLYAVDRRDATTYWMQRTAACWVDKAHPYDPEAH